MTIDTDFEWCGRPDIKAMSTDNTGNRVAVRDTISADMRAPTVVPVIPVIARRPGQSNVICLHVHPHIRFRQRLSGCAGVFEVGKNALTVQVT